MDNSVSGISKKELLRRRDFLKKGSLLGMGSLLAANIPLLAADENEKEPRIKAYRTLGRTGFKVSDISLGCTRLTDASIVRYAYDKGINYIDTAEGYKNGDSERMIGEAMQFMDREKLFITTKIHFDDDETVESIKNRFDACRKRMKVEYIDCFYMHSVQNVKHLNHAGFHQVVKELKSDGRLKYSGLSSHGPRQPELDSMEKVLTTAAEDGRFDVMLLVYNFMNREAGDKILAACKKNNVGTTAMKISPGIVKMDNYDPENLSDYQKRRFTRMLNRGSSEEKAHEHMKSWTDERIEDLKKYQPFFDKHNVKTQSQLKKSTIQWVLDDPRMHTVCLSFSAFDMIDEVLPYSGSKLSGMDTELLDKYGSMYNSHYCRHGCTECQDACPHNLPVSTIMRYAYYSDQGSEKLAISKYSKLDKVNADLCHDCTAPCLGNCPYKVDVQANLVHAHSLLTIA